MRVLQKGGLKWKFIIAVTAIVFLVSLLQNIVFYRLYINTYVQGMENRLSVLAKVLGYNSTSAIQFRSREDAVELLSSLRGEPSVRQGYIFDDNGQVLGEYVAEGTELSVPLADIGERRLYYTDEAVFVNQPVILDGKRIGAIYISAGLEELQEQAGFRSLLAVAALSVAVLIAWLLALWSQRFFIKPVVDLSVLSQEIGEYGKYHLRAEEVPSSDEIGSLVMNFNSMLRAIEARDRELSEKRRELENSNKELEQFAYVISHDLKSPLVTIQGFAGQFLKHFKTGNHEKAEDAAARVQNAARRMGLLIDDVLELSRAGRKRDRIVPVNLRDELINVRGDLEGMLEKAGASLVIGDRLPRVQADPKELRRVFQNLIANAVKYGCPRPGMTVTVDGLPGEHGDLVYVKDDGPGISEEYHDKIFQLFQRLDRDPQGTGLGLAIVTKVMKSLSGRAWVESEPGKGATFWLFFPDAGDVS